MEYVIYVAIAVLSFIAGLFIKSYFPSYFSEKGKNLATKQDITGITDKIESVRFEYLYKLEDIKTELSFTEKQKSRIKEKENDILLGFFEKCALLEEKLLYNFGNLTYTEKSYPVEYQKSIDNLFWEIRISRTRLHLYLPIEHDLQTKAENLFIQCAEIRLIFNKHFGHFKIALIEEMDALTEDDKAIIAEKCEKSDKLQNDYLSALRPFLDKFHIEFSALQIEIQKHFSESKNVDLIKSDSKVVV